MAYTVKKLAKLSGVSVRTLHFYDEIGLLKPAYYGDNNYRYYEEGELLMLQQILFYRELGFPLNDILRILKSNDFDKIESLKSHKNILEKKLDQTHQLIKTIDKTIAHLRGEIKMKDKELFYGLDSETQKRYERDLLDSGWVTEENLKQSREKVKNWTKEDWEKFYQEGGTLHQDFVKAIENKLKADSSEVQKLMHKHYQIILLPFWKPDKKSYLGLTEIYQMPEFKKFYDRFHPQLLSFLIEAMKIYAERKLS